MTPRSVNVPIAFIPDESWPLPPSIMIRSGIAAKLGSRSASCGERSACSTRRETRRESTSFIEAKSSGPPVRSPRIRKRL